MRASPKAGTIRLDSYALCTWCGRRVVLTETAGWLHLHVKIREQPQYCEVSR